MTNLEYAAGVIPQEEIEDSLRGHLIDCYGVNKEGKIIRCTISNCEECIFYHPRNDSEKCAFGMEKWLEQEHKEPEPDFETFPDFIKRMINTSYGFPFSYLEGLANAHHSLDHAIFIADLDKKIKLDLSAYNDKAFNKKLLEMYMRERKPKAGD